jgi:NTP pyrophosphatase (non-canonical NTP hydrolase)
MNNRTPLDFLKHICTWIGQIRDRHGFYTPKKITGDHGMTVQLADPSGREYFVIPGTPSDGDLMLGKLMLVVTELSEAAEAVRSGDNANFAEEIADAYIRLCDIVDATGIDIHAEIDKKMFKNEGRPVKHGRLTNL